MGNLGNPRLASQKDPPSYTLQKVKSGWTDLIAACTVVNQTFDMSFGKVTAASSGGVGTQLHTATTKSYDPIPSHYAAWGARVTERVITYWTIMMDRG